jgi:hypothetical protein
MICCLGGWCGCHPWRCAQGLWLRHGSWHSALGSWLLALGFRRSDLGSRLSAFGSRRLALGSRLSALGSRLSAFGSQLSAFGSWLSAFGSWLLLSAFGSIYGSGRPFYLISRLSVFIFAEGDHYYLIGGFRCNSSTFDERMSRWPI